MTEDSSQYHSQLTIKFFVREVFFFFFFPGNHHSFQRRSVLFCILSDSKKINFGTNITELNIMSWNHAHSVHSLYLQ